MAKILVCTYLTQRANIGRGKAQILAQAFGSLETQYVRQRKQIIALVFLASVMSA